MKYFSILRQVGLFWVVCGLFLLTACVTTEVSKEGIEDRAMGRWDALLSGDLAAAYEYLSPGIRSSVSSLQYQRSVLLQPVKWTAVKYTGSECKENRCNVMIVLDFMIQGGLPGVRAFEERQDVVETWLLTGGEWYFIPEQ